MEKSSLTYYSENYEGLLNSGLLGRLKGFTHRIIENQVPRGTDYHKVIEVGAGVGTHKKFVRHYYKSYLETDLRHSPYTHIAQMDAEALVKISDSEYDRLVATCLLAHLTNPEKALQEWRRIIKTKGLISIYVPCEPGMALRAFRFFTTNIKARLKGINHYRFHYTEHRNYYINLKYLIEEVFRDDKVSVHRFPFVFLSWNFNFFAVYTITVEKQSRD